MKSKWKEENYGLYIRYIHEDTGTDYDPEGFNVNGNDKDGYNREGYNFFGYNREGYNKEGFDKKGIHKDTLTEYDQDGFNKEGYDKDGFDKDGFDKDGFDRWGYDRERYDKEGYNRFGYNKAGYDRRGFDRKGIHKDTLTEYDKEGYDKKGYNQEGYNREGIDRTGKNREERAEIQQQQRRNWLGLRGKAERLAKGKMTIEEYIMTSKTSIEELITFAKKEHLSADIIRGLYKYKSSYKTYTRPFKKEEYLETTFLIIDGEEIIPTEQEVDACIEYLKANGSLICDKTVRTTISQYKRGEIDITQRQEQAVEESTKTQLETLEDEQRGLQETLENVEQLENEVAQAEKKINL